MSDLATDIELEYPKTKEDKFRLIRERYQSCVDAENTIRAEAVDDFKFIWIAGSQWDTNFGNIRGDRPKYEFNKLRQAVKQVVNDIRQNTPAIKVRPQHDENEDLAEIRQGIIRNIESQSNADTVYDWGALYSVSCGYGVWRVDTEYASGDSFDQEIRIKRIHNPFSVRFDPNATALTREDSRFAFVEDDISPAEFKKRWPKAEIRSFSSDTGDINTLRHWYGAKTIKIAEYWCVDQVEKDILLLDNGKVVDAEGFDEELAANPPNDPQTGQPMVPAVAVVERRTVQTPKVTMEIVSGLETLEGPFDWAGKYIPLIPAWGDFVHVDGKDEWYGMARMARDSVILNNFAMSTLAEQIASQPSAPFLYTSEQIKGYEEAWSNLAIDNAPGLPYNHIDGQPPPQRQIPPQMSQGYLTLLNVTSDAIKATTGLFDPSLGAKSNETSGKAIIARQREGDVANFDYSDSLARAIRFTGEVVNDLIPKVYDTQRSMRILGLDGAHKFVEVNKPVWNPKTHTFEVQNDIRSGKYDITITTGPSYTTQRMETLDACMQLAKSQGPMAMLAQYGVLKNMDTPGMDDIREAFRMQLVKQGLLQPEKDDQPQKPNPMMIAQLGKLQAEVQKMQADIRQKQAETVKTKLETVLLPKETEAAAIAQIGSAVLNIAKARGTSVQAMLDAGEVDAMIRYNAQQFGPGGDGAATPHNPHYVAPPDPMQQQQSAPDGFPGPSLTGAQS